MSRGPILRLGLPGWPRSLPNEVLGAAPIGAFLWLLVGPCASLPRAIYAGGFHCICVTSVHYARGVPMGAYI